MIEKSIKALASNFPPNGQVGDVELTAGTELGVMDYCVLRIDTKLRLGAMGEAQDSLSVHTVSKRHSGLKTKVCLDETVMAHVCR
jgi:hypothetical protein